MLTAGLLAAGAVALPWAPRAAAGSLPEPLRSPDAFDGRILELMRAGKLPGLSAAVVRGDELLWSRGYGWANVHDREPVGRGTLFMLASISKTVVATAVMQAVEEGLFGLDDDVNDILPFPVRTPAHPHRAITARQLLTHTSSIRDRWSVWKGLYADGDSPIPLGGFLQDYLVPGGAEYREGNFYDARPGSAYHYSNIGAALAAYLVEAASGDGFDAWCRARIFEPLEMTRAGWHLADVPAADVAMPYRWSGSEGRYVAIGQYGYPDYPDGALRTTASQLARQVGMMMNGGTWQGTRVLEGGSVREMLRPQSPDLAPGQGLIWYRTRNERRALIGHTGGDKGVATAAFIDTDLGLGAIVLANGNWRLADGRWPIQQILRLLFDRFS